MFSCLIAHNALIQLRGLRILALLPLVHVVALAGHNVIRHRIWSLRGVWTERGLEAVRDILLIAGMISIHAHGPVEIDAGIIASHERAVDGDLVQVDANAVVLSVSIEKHAELEQWVWAFLDTGHHATGRECSLLDIAMEVLGVLVQDQFAELMHGELTARPDFGNIEGIEAELVGVGLFRLHYLDICFPCDFFAFLNGLPELFLGVIWVLTGGHDGLRLCHLLLPMRCEEVVLDVDKFALLVDPARNQRLAVSLLPLANSPLESVAAITVIMDPPVWCPVIAEEHQPGMIAANLSAKHLVLCRDIFTLLVYRPGDRRWHHSPRGNSSGCELGCG